MSKKFLKMVFVIILLSIILPEIQSISLLNTYQRFLEKNQQVAARIRNTQHTEVHQAIKNIRASLKINRLSPTEIEEARSQTSVEDDINTEVFYDESGGVYHVPKGRLRISEIVGSGSAARNILIQ